MADDKAKKADDLSEKKPVELRAIARDLGIEGADRLTGPAALEAIKAHEGTTEQDKH